MDIENEKNEEENRRDLLKKLETKIRWGIRKNLSQSLDLTISWYSKNFNILKNKKWSYEHKK